MIDAVFPAGRPLREEVLTILKHVTPEDALDWPSLEEASRRAVAELDSVKAEVSASIAPSASEKQRVSELAHGLVSRLVAIRNNHLRAMHKLRIEAAEYQWFCEAA